MKNLESLLSKINSAIGFQYFDFKYEVVKEESIFNQLVIKTSVYRTKDERLWISTMVQIDGNVPKKIELDNADNLTVTTIIDDILFSKKINSKSGIVDVAYTPFENFKEDIKTVSFK